MYLWGIDIAPITGAIVFAIALIIVCFGVSISILFIRTAMFIEMAGEKKEKETTNDH